MKITTAKAIELAETYITLEGIKMPSQFEKDIAVANFVAGGVYTFAAMAECFDFAAEERAEMEMAFEDAHNTRY